MKGAEVTCRGQLLIAGSQLLCWGGRPGRAMIGTDEITAHLTAGKVVDHLIAIRTLVARGTHLSGSALGRPHARLAWLAWLAMRNEKFTVHGTYQADRDGVHAPAEDVVGCPYLRPAEERRKVGWLICLPTLQQSGLECCLNERLNARRRRADIVGLPPVGNGNRHRDHQNPWTPIPGSLVSTDVCSRQAGCRPEQAEPPEHGSGDLVHLAAHHFEVLPAHFDPSDATRCQATAECLDAIEGFLDRLLSLSGPAAEHESGNHSWCFSRTCAMRVHSDYNTLCRT